MSIESISRCASPSSSATQRTTTAAYARGGATPAGGSNARPIDEMVTSSGATPTPANIEQFYADRPRYQGGSVEAKRECAQLVAYHQQQQASEPCAMKRELRDIELLTSRLADREMQVGDCIPLSHGAFVVSAVFVREGAYVACLEDIAQRLPPKLVCRGTSMRWNATQNWQSGLNNVLPELASRGVHAVWPDLQSHCQRIGATSVEILGKSMGGACAQQLAILFETVARIQVVKLTTHCSVGVGAQINALFKEKVLHNRREPFNMFVVRSGGRADGSGADYVPFVGGEHLGFDTSPSQCYIKICYIGPDAEVCPPQRGGVVQMSQRFLASFPGAHSRQTTLKQFDVASYTERADIDSQLNMGTALEGARQGLASWLSWSGLTAPVPGLVQIIAEAERSR